MVGVSINTSENQQQTAVTTNQVLHVKNVGRGENYKVCTDWEGDPPAKEVVFFPRQQHNLEQLIMDLPRQANGLLMKTPTCVTVEAFSSSFSRWISASFSPRAACSSATSPGPEPEPAWNKVDNQDCFFCGFGTLMKSRKMRIQTSQGSNKKTPLDYKAI